MRNTELKDASGKGLIMDMQGMALLIPIIAITFSLSIPIIAIITEAAKRRRIYELYHKERLAAIEKGIELPPLPPELFEKESSRGRRRPRYLLGGLVWLLVGLSLLVALYYDERQREWALYALIPTGVGLAYLLYYALEGRKEQDSSDKSVTGGIRS
jgi:hypothetical protein